MAPPYSWFHRAESDLDPAVPLLDESAIRTIAGADARG
jgi:hypothetical protein